MKIDDIADVLGCSKAAASMLRSGKYERKGGELHARYQALVRLVDAEAARARVPDITAICRACPREDCTGCRIAEI